jgi:hypothetical protein
VSPFSLGDDRGGFAKAVVRLGRVSRSSTKKNETVFGGASGTSLPPLTYHFGRGVLLV